MNKLFYLIIIILCAHITAYSGGTQVTLSNIACAGNVYNISTGINQLSNDPLGFGSNDSRWVVRNTPPSFLVTPFASYVPFPDASWGNLGQSRWINSPVIYSLNETGIDFPFVFETCFCIDDSTLLSVNFMALSDNNILVNLIDATNDSIITYLGDNFGQPFPETNPTVISDNINVLPGQYCIQVELYADSIGPFGFAAEGIVSGSNILYGDCCDANISCLPNLSILNTEIDPNTYEVEDWINSNGEILTNDTVSFYAGQNINLGPSFSVGPNSDFEAVIENCDTFTLYNICPLDAPANFQISNVVGNMVTLEWDPVAGASGYFVEYAADSNALIIDIPVSGTTLTLPVDYYLYARHQFTIFTVCPSVFANNIQGATVNLESSSSAAIATCPPPLNVTYQITNGNLVEIFWDNDPVNTQNFSVQVFVDNDLVSNYPIGPSTSFTYTIDPTSDLSYEFLVFNLCDDGSQSYAASIIVIIEIDLPGDIEKICQNRFNRHALYECLGSPKAGTFDCLHYKGITYDQWFKCHCEPEQKKAKKELPPTCP